MAGATYGKHSYDEYSRIKELLSIAGITYSNYSYDAILEIILGFRFKVTSVVLTQYFHIDGVRRLVLPYEISNIIDPVLEGKYQMVYGPSIIAFELESDATLFKLMF